MERRETAAGESQNGKMGGPLKILRDSTPSTHLNIFFPKLRKVLKLRRYIQHVRVRMTI